MSVFLHYEVLSKLREAFIRTCNLSGAEGFIFKYI